MSQIMLGTFVSEKISKVRWMHENFAEPTVFITGSWDNPVNRITFYLLPRSNNEEEFYPVDCESCPVIGDVTEIKFIGYDNFVASSSMGTVKIFKMQVHPCIALKEQYEWNTIHYFSKNDPAPCTGLATFEQDIVTVGQDGRINLLTALRENPVRRIDDADSCSLYCVDFLRHSEILTGNIRGHMKVWDLRNDQDVPATTIMLSEQTKTETTCIAHHPTQKHIVVAGGGDGSLTVWDLRYNTYPISQLNAHSKSVSEILFHKDRPDNLFTCSISGEMWHWNNARNSKLKLGDTDTHWLNTVGNKGKLQVNSICSPLHKPINSIDIDQKDLLFACDNEAIYIVKNVMV